jgi:hypothetical protein
MKKDNKGSTREKKDEDETPCMHAYLTSLGSLLATPCDEIERILDQMLIKAPLI